MQNIQVAGGRVKAGPGWQSDGETSIVRRALRLEVRLAQRTVLPPPMRHLSIAALVECPIELLSRLRAKLRTRVPQLSVEGEGVFRFADGRQGHYLSVEMELLPGMRSKQLHVVRSDAGVTRHFVATVAGLDAGGLDLELEPMIRSFRLGAKEPQIESPPATA